MLKYHSSATVNSKVSVYATDALDDLQSFQKKKYPDVSIRTQYLGLMVTFQALSGFGMQLEQWNDVTFMICARWRRHHVHFETQD